MLFFFSFPFYSAVVTVSYSLPLLGIFFFVKGLVPPENPPITHSMSFRTLGQEGSKYQVRWSQLIFMPGNFHKVEFDVTSSTTYFKSINIKHNLQLSLTYLFNFYKASLHLHKVNRYYFMYATDAHQHMPQIFDPLSVPWYLFLFWCLKFRAQYCFRLLAS